MPEFTLAQVTDAIGLEVYSFLQPRELFNLSLTSRHLFQEIRKNLIQVALRQLPPILDDNLDRVEYQVTVSDKHSFSNREQLLRHVLEKIEMAELKFAGQTMEESIANAREVLNNEKKPGVYGTTLMSPTNDRFPDPEYTHVGYNYQQGNREVASIRSKDILERMALLEDVSNDAIHMMKAWIGYLFAQDSLVIGSWFWSCRHRNLDFQGVEGKGILFSRTDSPGGELEIGWVIMTKSKVGVEEEVSPVVPQFAVATIVDETSGADVNQVEPESESSRQEHFNLDGTSRTVASNHLSAESEQLSWPFVTEIVLREDDVIVVPIEEETLLAEVSVEIHQSKKRWNFGKNIFSRRKLKSGSELCSNGSNGDSISSNISIDERIVRPDELNASPNYDGLSDDSSTSEFGCGSYHRRESLPESSSGESVISSASQSSCSPSAFDMTQPARPPPLDDASEHKTSVKKFKSSLGLFKPTARKWRRKKPN